MQSRDMQPVDPKGDPRLKQYFERRTYYIHDAFHCEIRQATQQKITDTFITPLSGLGFSENDLRNIFFSHPTDGEISYLLHETKKLIDHLSAATVSDIFVGGGIRSLIATDKNLAFFVRHDFTEREIRQIARKSGGRLAIETLAKHYDELRSLRYTHEQIYLLSCGPGAHTNLEALLAHTQKLLDAKFTYGFTTYQLSIQNIADIAKSPSGHLRLEMLTDFTKSGQQVNFSQDQLITAACYSKGKSTDRLGTLLGITTKKTAKKRSVLVPEVAKPTEDNTPDDFALFQHFIINAADANKKPIRKKSERKLKRPRSDENSSESSHKVPKLDCDSTPSSTTVTKILAEIPEAQITSSPTAPVIADTQRAANNLTLFAQPFKEYTFIAYDPTKKPSKAKKS